MLTLYRMLQHSQSKIPFKVVCCLKASHNLFESCRFKFVEDVVKVACILDPITQIKLGNSWLLMGKQSFLLLSQKSREEVLESYWVTHDPPNVKLLGVVILQCLHQALSLAPRKKTTTKIRSSLLQGNLQRLKIPNLSKQSLNSALISKSLRVCVANCFYTILTLLFLLIG